MLFTTALVAQSIAFANPGDATLTIDNRFDGAVEVFVDGKREGVAAANADTSFQVRPGTSDVRVVRANTGFLLAAARFNLAPRSAALLPVVAPAGTVRIDNDGEVALKLEVAGATTWLQPGSAAVLPVKAGYVEIDASVRDPRGDWMVAERALWVEPGVPASTRLKPDPSVIVVTNRQSVAVRAMVDGIDAGWVQPGETERVWVRPGATRVVMVDRVGRVLSTNVFDADRGEVLKVVVTPPVVVVRR